MTKKETTPEPYIARRRARGPGERINANVAPDARAALAEMSSEDGLSESAVLERIIREEHARRARRHDRR